MHIRHNAQLENAAEQLRVDIYNTGYAELDAGYPSHDYAGAMCFLFFVEEGQGELIVGEQNVPFLPGYVYFIPCGISWNIHYRTNVRKFFVDFNIFDQNGENLFGDSTTILTLPFSTQELATLRKQYFSEKTEQLFAVKSTLFGLMTECLRLSRTESALHHYHPAVQKTIHYIQNHMSLKLTTKVLAEHSGVSASFLAARFKEEMGIPIGKYIHCRILCQARLELERQAPSVAEISQKLGFCDQFYFSRFFKKNTGETPTQYRQHYAAHFYNIGVEE